MPLPNFAQLQASPDLLLNWLKTNLLLAGFIRNVDLNANPPITDEVTIVTPPGPAANAVDTNSNPIGVYALTNNPAMMPGGAVSPATTLASYICDYTANGRHHVDVGNQRDYCFTTNLNGCTYAIGPANNQHVRRVSHVNRGGNLAFQRMQTKLEHGTQTLAGLTVLEPAVYRRMSATLNMQATVFGIRSGLQWKFYFQSYSAHMGGGYRYKMYGVFPIL